MAITLKFGYLILFSVISGILYRAGGMSKNPDTQPKWIPIWIRKSWVRDWLCPLIVLIALWLLVGFKLSYWWAYLIFWGLSGVALSTYWDWLFGYDNHYAHGAGCGVAGFILVLVIPWWVCLIRLAFCISMGLYSKFIKKDVPQEIIRGILFIL